MWIVKLALNRPYTFIVLALLIFVLSPLPEVYATAIKSGETVMLTLDAFPGEKFTGTLVRDSSSIDLTSRTLRVEVDVDNPSGRLLPGA